MSRNLSKTSVPMTTAHGTETRTPSYRYSIPWALSSMFRNPIPRAFPPMDPPPIRAKLPVGSNDSASKSVTDPRAWLRR